MKTVFLAPHLRMPLRDASSRRSYEIARWLGSRDHPVLLAGKNAVWEMSESAVRQRQLIPGRNDKLRSACGALWSGGHYLVYKHLTTEWSRTARALMEKTQPETVVVSFLWAYPLLRPDLGAARVLIDTHNYDPEWWGNFREHTRNPIRRRLACRAETYVMRVLQDLPPSVELIHVSERDRDLYRKHRPDLRHHVLPNGCTPSLEGGRADYRASVKKLYFIGLLSSQMSQDALKYFAVRFWPELRDFCDFWVMGADPDAAIKKMCRQQGWKSAYDLTEEEVTQHLDMMHYLVLPFQYGAGTKLKLVDACGRGVPVLATSAGVTGFSSLPKSVFVAESPHAWRGHVLEHIPSRVELEEARYFGHEYAWQNLVARFREEASL